MQKFAAVFNPILFDATLQGLAPIQRIIGKTWSTRSSAVDGNADGCAHHEDESEREVGCEQRHVLHILVAPRPQAATRRAAGRPDITACPCDVHTASLDDPYSQYGLMRVLHTS